MENEKLLEYAALAECASSHPISKSLQRAYGKAIDRDRVRDIQERSAARAFSCQWTATPVLAGNDNDGAARHSVYRLPQRRHDHPYRHRRAVRGHIVISDV